MLKGVLAPLQKTRTISLNLRKLRALWIGRLICLARFDCGLGLGKSFLCVSQIGRYSRSLFLELRKLKGVLIGIEKKICDRAGRV